MTGAVKKSAAIMLLSVLILTGCAKAPRIPDESSTQGEITAETLPDNTEKPLIVLSEPDMYTYDNLMSDVASLQQTYTDKIQVLKLCETADGRDVCDIVVGNQQCENQMLILGAMHAREYITSQLVMRQLLDCLDVLYGSNGEEFNGLAKKEILDGITIHFIPMSNPDGVTISQLGPEAIRNQSLRDSILNLGIDDYSQWKANAEGVDLNRNFDAGWTEYTGATYPSSERYKGEYPGSAPEAAALIKLTNDYNFKRTISYHTCGSLIYWYYKQNGQVLEKSRSFAQRISNETGYVMDGNYQAVDAAGYKDWAVYKKSIPSLTIEVGDENGYGIINPVPMSRFGDIWQRNKNVVYAASYDLKY